MTPALEIVGLGCALTAILGSLEWTRLLRAEPSLAMGRPVSMLLVGRSAAALSYLAGAITADRTLLTFGTTALLTFALGVFVVMRVGLEAADYVHLGMLSVLAYSLLAPWKEVSDETAELFAAALLVLTYEVAGTAKLRSQEWGSGRALAQILGTRTFGYPRLVRFLPVRAMPWRALEWSVMIMECSFFLMLVLPPPVVLTLTVLWVGFHLVIAVVMGLNLFLITFVSGYPILLAVNHELYARVVA